MSLYQFYNLLVACPGMLYVQPFSGYRSPSDSRDFRAQDTPSWMKLSVYLPWSVLECATQRSGGATYGTPRPIKLSISVFHAALVVWA